MAKKETTERKPFNFGDSPLVKTTEQTVVDGYEAIEKKEQGGGLSTGSPAPSPMGSGQSSAPAVQPYRETSAIPASVAIGNGEPTQNINVPIPVSLHQQLKIFAAQTKQNMKDLVVVAIKEYMDRQAK